jgi:hypothetical protein
MDCFPDTPFYTLRGNNHLVEQIFINVARSEASLFDHLQTDELSVLVSRSQSIINHSKPLPLCSNSFRNRSSVIRLKGI